MLVVRLLLMALRVVVDVALFSSCVVSLLSMKVL